MQIHLRYTFRNVYVRYSISGTRPIEKRITILPCVLHPERIRGTYPRLKVYSDLWQRKNSNFEMIPKCRREHTRVCDREAYREHASSRGRAQKGVFARLVTRRGKRNSRAQYFYPYKEKLFERQKNSVPRYNLLGTLSLLSVKFAREFRPPRYSFSERDLYPA